METLNMNIILTILTLLISVIAFFLNALHRDFKKVQEEVTATKTITAVIRTDLRASQALITQRSNFIEQRIDQLEELMKASDPPPTRKKMLKLKSVD